MQTNLLNFLLLKFTKQTKKASSESGSLKPWTNLAKYKLQAEEALKAIDGLPVIFVRPAICYGLGDVAGVCPRVITAAVYKHLGEKMKFLWSSDLRLNTVHVNDVSKALWHLSQADVEIGSTWNLSDKNDTTQDSINKILERIFGISTGFHGKALSKIASLKLKETTDIVNDKHLKPWSDLCKAHNILNTPLTPYIDQELLYNNHLSVDGSAIEGTGFEYDQPQMNDDQIKEAIAYFVDQNLFPPLE
jgi:nucleoside-diphosphate-sugar epimerase